MCAIWHACRSLAVSFLVLVLLLATTTPSKAFSTPAFTSHVQTQQFNCQRTLPSTRIGLFRSVFGGNSEATTPPVVFEIGAKDVKIGALRFLLQIQLVGLQNKPEPNTWLTKQGEDGELEVYFQDGSAMLSIQFQEYGIKVIRYGEKPSLQYLLQESVLLHEILDELETVALGVEDIEEDKRLLQLSDADAIDKAREKLPARKEA